MDSDSVKRPPGRTTRWPLWVGGAVLALGLGAVLFLQPPTKSGRPPAEISVARAAALRDQGSFMLDVRQPEEWDEAHIPGATLIPLGELPARVGDLPRDREIVVVCRSGNRSKRGRDILRRAGFEHVTSMAGGMIAWKEKGQPTVGGP